jgi:hypothetical protein
MTSLGPSVALASFCLLMAGCAQLHEVDEYPPIACDQEPDQRVEADPWFEGKWLAGEGPPLINWTGCDRSAAQLANSYLGSAQLSKADLSSADLSMSYLSAANLTGANLQGADLRGAVMQAVFLRDADLSQANLDGAVLSGTFLGADFSGATWIDGRRCAEGSVGECR